MIKIIAGIYGRLCDDGVVRPVTSADGPFHLSDEQEKRLVDSGVAEYVSVSIDEGYDKIENEPEEESLEYGPDSTMSELRAVAREHGIEVKAKDKKADLIKRLDAELWGTEVSPDEMPNLTDLPTVE